MSQSECGNLGTPTPDRSKATATSSEAKGSIRMIPAAFATQNTQNTQPACSSSIMSSSLAAPLCLQRRGIVFLCLCHAKKVIYTRMTIYLRHEGGENLTLFATMPWVSAVDFFECDAGCAQSTHAENMQQLCLSGFKAAALIFSFLLDAQAQALLVWFNVIYYLKWARVHSFELTLRSQPLLI